MTGPEMVRLMNQLSSSLAQQSLSGNYGVGAKVAAVTRNHYGVIYLSWKNAMGTMIHLYRDPITEQYGLKQWKRSDGTYAHYMPIEDDVKPTSSRITGPLSHCWATTRRTTQSSPRWNRLTI